MEPITFDERVAVVTGAGNGLGRTYALELARRGARVVVNDLGGRTDGTGGGSSGAADAVVAEIRSAGGAAVANHDSVATPEGGRSIVEAAIERWGRIDIVINNAGSLRDRSFVKLEPADLEAMLDVHLRGAFHVTHAAWPHMRDRHYGRVLLTSSTSGVFGNFGQANYAAAKAGLIGLSNVLAIEGAKHDISSNVLCPVAYTRLTEDVMGGLDGRLVPEHVTALAVYLVSSECSLNHEIVIAGGGWYGRAFIGVTPGWSAAPGTVATVEDIREHLAEIRTEDGYAVPLESEQAVGATFS